MLTQISHPGAHNVINLKITLSEKSQMKYSICSIYIKFQKIPVNQSMVTEGQLLPRDSDRVGQGQEERRVYKGTRTPLRITDIFIILRPVTASCINICQNVSSCMI